MTKTVSLFLTFAHPAGGRRIAPDALVRVADMEEMRAEFRRLPPFTGGNVHHPMATLSVVP